MSSERKRYSVGELTINHDAKRIPVKEADRKPGEYPYYGASGIVDWVDQYIFDGEFLLVAEDGENLRSRKTPVAFMATGRFWVNNHAHIIQGNQKADTRFLAYLLEGSDISGYLTGSTIPKLSQGNLNAIEIEVPGVEEQKAIAHILGTLDNKIELNHKTNETLEAMAKALFRSWFVDFNPVRAKAEGRPTGLPDEISELFPDSFEESELGEMPSGWRATCLDEITEYVIGGDWGKDESSDDFPFQTLCIRGADIPDLQGFGLGKMPTRFLKESSTQKRSLRHGDIVFEISGGSPTQSTGRPVLIESEMTNKFKIPLTCSNFCRLVRPLSIEHSRYLYYHLRKAYDQGEMFMYETGTTGIKNFGYKHYASSRFFPMPEGRLLSIFASVIGTLRQRCHSSGSENSTLASLRDALLPQLISGELRVPEAERMLEQVGI